MSKSWEDYWQEYRKLISLLRNAEHEDIAHALEDALTYVNGFTDGWHQFKDAFEEVIETYKQDLTKEQHDLAISLLQTVKTALSYR